MAKPCRQKEKEGLDDGTVARCYSLLRFSGPWLKNTEVEANDLLADESFTALRMRQAQARHVAHAREPFTNFGEELHKSRGAGERLEGETRATLVSVLACSSRPDRCWIADRRQGSVWKSLVRLAGAVDKKTLDGEDAAGMNADRSPYPLAQRHRSAFCPLACGARLPFRRA